MYNLEGLQATWRNFKRRHMTEMLIVSFAIVIGGAVLMAVAK